MDEKYTVTLNGMLVHAMNLDPEFSRSEGMFVTCDWESAVSLSKAEAEELAARIDPNGEPTEICVVSLLLVRAEEVFNQIMWADEEAA